METHHASDTPATTAVVAPTPETAPVDEQSAREYAASRGIEWADVEATQRLVDALIAARIGSDRVRMQQVVDRHASGHHNFVKAFINARELGITGTDILNGMRRDFVDCLCGRRFDPPHRQEETTPSADSERRVE